jgi:hypothetical protein
MRGVLILALAALSACPQAAEPEPKHSVSFEVKVLRAGASTNTSQTENTDRINRIRNTTTAVFERKKSGQWELEVSVQNFARQPDIVKFEWLFFGQDVEGSDPFAFSNGAKELVLKPGGGTKFAAVSDLALSTESRRTQVDRIDTGTERLNVPTSRESARAGTKIVGWLVRAMADGKVLGFKASSPRFERFASDDQLHELMKRSEDRGNGFVR